MFTGIVQLIAEVSWVNITPNLTQYGVILPNSHCHDLALGASVSVHGICQSVVSIDNNCVSFDAIGETLARTTLSNLQVGQRLNIERSAKIGDEIGGHILSGHIMGTASVTNVIQIDSNQHILKFSCPPSWMKYIFPKGYIAINGVSLTVVDTDARGYFSVHLIPETLKRTTFGQISEGERVNIEIDSQTQAIVTTVENYMSTHLNAH